MMDFRDFLALAKDLGSGASEAAWRFAVSRAYYASFHIARQLLKDLGFAVPRAERAHAYLSLRLSNCGLVECMRAGQDLNDLRQERNRADYDDGRPFTLGKAASLVRTAEEVIRVLDAARTDPTRTL